MTLRATAVVPLPVMVKRPGRVDYRPAFEAMQRFTAARTPDTPDEIWLLEHPPVYTLGQSGRAEHLLQATTIPVEKIDRGGQITYHGPGQLVVYLLLNLNRRGIRVRALVNLIEQALIDCLADYGLRARRREGAPGVYIDEAKIAALGLRIRNGCSYHGLALNVDMDLTPFSAINPCGYAGLKTVQLRDFGIEETVQGAGDRLLAHLVRLLDTLQAGVPEHNPVHHTSPLIAVACPFPTQSTP